jgi:hypothetical protein
VSLSPLYFYENIDIMLCPSVSIIISVTHELYRMMIQKTVDVMTCT